MPQARISNVAQALAASAPYVEKRNSEWELTDTGRTYVETLLELDTSRASPPTQVDEDAAALTELVEEVSDAATKEYLLEAVQCLKAGARRAAVVFVWTGAVATIREEVWTFGVKAIESALQRHNPNYRFRKKDDFWRVKDVDLLTVAQGLGVYDQSQRKRLGEALDLRNDCGHPVKYKPREKKVASFVEDVCGIVWP